MPSAISGVTHPQPVAQPTGQPIQKPASKPANQAAPQLTAQPAKTDTVQLSQAAQARLAANQGAKETPGKPPR
jgi:hypothetical protein